MAQPFDIIIRNGQVVNADGSARLDVGIRGGKIVALSAAIEETGDTEIDATDRLVFPGFIDVHTHMGIPIMDTHSIDDFESGSVAAACGGVTSIVDFTVQQPGQTLRESVEVRLGKAESKAHVDYALHVNVTDKPLQRVAEIPELIRSGYSAFKVFSTYRQAGMMITWPEFREVLDVVHQNGGLLFLHAEDNALVETQTAHNVASAHKAPIYHARSRTSEAEAKAVTTAARIARELEAPLYIVHLSSRAGLEAALEARAVGAKLLLETCPQYLVLTEEKYLGDNGHHWITTPALRTEEDTKALWQAVTSGDIDVVATDHCPFTTDQKNAAGAFHLTPNGIPGVETLFPLLYTCGVVPGRISKERLVELLAATPAVRLGLDERKGVVRRGADADVVIWNPNATWRVQASLMHGNADWSPYEGMDISGKVEHVFLRGQPLVTDGEFVGQRVHGQCLHTKK